MGPRRVQAARPVHVAGRGGHPRRSTRTGAQASSKAPEAIQNDDHAGKQREKNGTRLTDAYSLLRPRGYHDLPRRLSRDPALAVRYRASGHVATVQPDGVYGSAILGHVEQEQWRRWFSTAMEGERIPRRHAGIRLSGVAERHHGRDRGRVPRRRQPLLQPPGQMARRRVLTPGAMVSPWWVGDAAGNNLESWGGG